MSLLVGSPSKIVIGHVLDSNIKGVESALKFYDPLLYLKWNPKKLQGYGCWELRRRPELKKVIEVIDSPIGEIAVLDYKEYDWVHHVKDFPYCDYRILEWVKENDLFKNEYAHRNGLLGEVIEQNVDATVAINEKKLEDEQTYLAKHTKSEWRQVMQEMDSGTSLAGALRKRGF